MFKCSWLWSCDIASQRFQNIYFIDLHYYYKISARADGGPRSPSAHAWRSARPPIDTSGNFSAHMSGGGGENCQRVFLINFLAKSENYKNFSFFSQKKKNLVGGGGKIFKIFFWPIFSPNQAILSTFRFFHIFQNKINCGHYFCLPSTKIVVTMFACHLHSSDQSCVCRVTFKHLPQPRSSHIQSFRTRFSQKNLKKT
jgi:hypothetical protein